MSDKSLFLSSENQLRVGLGVKLISSYWKLRVSYQAVGDLGVCIGDFNLDPTEQKR